MIDCPIEVLVAYGSAGACSTSRCVVTVHTTETCFPYTTEQAFLELHYRISAIVYYSSRFGVCKYYLQMCRAKQLLCCESLHLLFVVL